MEFHDDQRLTADLKTAVRRVLRRHGFDFRVDGDIERWRYEMQRRDAWITPQFDPKYCVPEEARWLGIWRGEELGAAIAWRMFETEDMIEDIETGRFLYDDPSGLGFQRYETGFKDVLRIRGRVCHRGGLHSWDRGRCLSFYCGTLMTALGIEEECDVAMSTALPDIAHKNLPYKSYGYANQSLLPTHYWPNLRRWVRVLLVWSSAAQLREQCLQRTHFLAAREREDLGDIALAFDPGQQAEEHV